MNLNKYLVKLQNKNHKTLMYKGTTLWKVSDICSTEKPLVSIICNTYNHKDYIKKCLDSFLNQSVNFNVEILVHDDASTDGTSDIVREYTKKYSNIIFSIIQKENQYSKGVKIGIKYQYPRARGKYIAFCEGDDMWIDTYKLIQEVNILENNQDVFAVVHDVVNFDCKRNKIAKHLYKKHKNGYLSFKDICDGLAYQSSSLLYRKNLEIDNGIPKDLYVFNHLGDFPKSVNLFLHGNMYFINKKMSLYRYKSNPESFTSSCNGGMYENFVLFFENLKKYVSEEKLEYVKFKISELKILRKYYTNKFEEIFNDPEIKSVYKKLNFGLRFKIFMHHYFNWACVLYRKVFKAQHY